MHESTVNLSGKVAVITGASRGIGEAIAYRFAQAGASVVVTARTLDDGDHKLAGGINNVVETIRSFGGTAIAIRADLGLEDHRCELIKAIERRVGPVDILINNAGASWGAPFDEFPESGWDKVMDINVKSLFFLTQQLAPMMRASATPEQPAKVINIASTDGLSNSRIETYSYSASKAAVIHLTRRLANRLAEDNIRVNAIAPGAFASNMNIWARDNPEGVAPRIPAKRIGKPDDIAGTAVYMCSRAGDFLLGATIPLDGGTVYGTLQG